MKTHAIQMARAGIPVFPLHSIVKGQCSCGKEDCTSKGKHPRTSGGFTKATTDVTQIEKWWDQWPDANIGMPTGQVSGIVVVDSDSPEAQQKLVELVGSQLDGALQVTTGKGTHYWFRQPDCVIPNSAGALWEHLDMRGDGGYVVVPPSNHISGNKYAWANETSISNLGEFPSALKNLITGNGKVEWATEVISGKRNVTLTQQAGKLIAAGVPPNVVELTLRGLNQTQCKPPLPDAEIATIVKSVAKIDSKKKESKDFSIISLGEALRKYGGYETQWSIEGWLPSSTVGLVVAPPSSWKTWILADLAVAVAGGRPFLGKYKPAETGPVLFIQQEDFLPMTLARISTIMGASLPTETKNGLIELPTFNENIPLYIHDRRQLHFENRESVYALRNRIVELKPKLVVIDPLYSAVSMDDYMAKSAQSMMVLKDFRDEFGCTFMVAHHTTKQGGSSRTRDDLWGSQFLNAWLETGWQMRLTSSDTKVEVTRHFKMSKNPEKIALQFNVDDYQYNVTECIPDKEEPKVNQKSADEKARAQMFNAMMKGGKR